MPVKTITSGLYSFDIFTISSRGIFSNSPSIIFASWPVFSAIAASKAKLYGMNVPPAVFAK